MRTRVSFAAMRQAFLGLTIFGCGLWGFSSAQPLGDSPGAAPGAADPADTFDFPDLDFSAPPTAPAPAPPGGAPSRPSRDELRDLISEQLGTMAEQLDPEVRAAYIDGIEAMSQGEYQRAVEKFTEVLSKDNRILDAVYRRGQALAALGRHAEAISQFSIVLSVNPRYAEAYYLRGRSFAAMGEFDLAVKSFSRAILYGRTEPFRYLFYSERGKAYSALNRFREALDDFDQAIELQPADPDVLFNRGSTLLKLGMQSRMMGDPAGLELIESAIASIDQALMLREDFADAYFERGIARLEMNELDEAVEDFEAAIGIDPTNLRFLERRAYAQLSLADRAAQDDTTSRAQLLEKYRAAVDAFSQVIEMKKVADAAESESPPAAEEPLPGAAADTLPGIPGLEDVLEELAPVEPPAAEEATPRAVPAPRAARRSPRRTENEVLLHQLYVARAIARIRTAQYLTPSEAEAMYHEALADLDASLELDPEQPPAHFQRGVVLRMLGDFREAANAFTRAIDQAPGYAEAHFRRGIVWFHLGEYDLARQDFEDANLGGRDFRALFWSGMVHAQVGEYPQALMAYSESIRLNPAYTLAYANRGLAYLHLERYDRAIRDFNEVIRRDRYNAQAYFRRGVAYEAAGSPLAAIQSYEQAVRIDPRFAAAHRRLAKVYRDLGDEAKSVEHLQRVQELEPVEL